MSVTVKSNVSDVKTLKRKKGSLFIEVTAGVVKDKPKAKKTSSSRFSGKAATRKK